MTHKQNGWRTLQPAPPGEPRTPQTPVREPKTPGNTATTADADDTQAEWIDVRAEWIDVDDVPTESVVEVAGATAGTRASKNGRDKGAEQHPDGRGVGVTTGSGSDLQGSVNSDEGSKRKRYAV